MVNNENTATDAATGETTVDFDLTLYKNGAKVSGDTIYEIEIPVGNVYVTSVKHNNELLTESASGADQTYKIENGVLTVYTKSFSPFSYSFLTGDLIADKEGEQAYAMTFDEFRASVNAGNDFSGWMVMLQKDIDFGGAEWTPIGVAAGADDSLEGCAPFSGMFDGNGHTLSNYVVTNGITVGGNPWLSLFALIYAKDGNTAGVKNLSLANVFYNNANGTVGVIVNFANSDGASALEFSNIEISGTVNAFGVYGQAGIATLMYGSEVTVSGIDLDVDFIIPADFTSSSYKFISPCIGQISMIENGHITFADVDWSDCNYLYPDVFTLEDRSTVAAGYNSIWVYDTLTGIRVLGCGGYSAQFYDRGITVTIDGNDYTHADLKKDQKDVPGYMYDYIIRPDAFTPYTAVTTVDELKSAITNAKDGDVIIIANDITVTDKWDNRYGGKTDKYVTIDGLGNTLKFTGVINDGLNYHAVFRFTADAVVKNLTFDFSDAAADTYLRAISATSDLTVDNCTFIGSDNYTKDNAIVFGDTNATAQIDASVSITNCTFINWRRGVSDNENLKEVKSLVISGNTFEAANVYVSVYGDVTFTDNEMDGSLVSITSYTNSANVKVVVTDNELDAELDGDNVIGSANRLFTAANVTAQEGMTVNAQ